MANKRLVKFNLEDGSSIMVEVEEFEALGGTARAGRKPNELFDEARQTFEQALDKVHAATEAAVTKLRNLGQKPDEVEMEFGFNLSAEFGAVIASATTEANYKVTLRWTRQDG